MIALLFLLNSLTIGFIWFGKRNWAVYSFILLLLLSSLVFVLALDTQLNLNL